MTEGLTAISVANPCDPDMADLIRRHAAYGDAHYAAESNHHLSPEDLDRAGATLFAMRDGSRPVAMGALAPLGNGAAEIKSMHVVEDMRGRGLGARMLGHLVAEAQARGLTSLWLETGSREASAAARATYARAGFRFCEPFGTYVADPESVFMTLTLNRNAAS